MLRLPELDQDVFNCLHNVSAHLQKPLLTRTHISKVTEERKDMAREIGAVLLRSEK